MQGTIIDVWNGGLSEMRRPVDVDLREDLQFPLTYQIADIREPQSRKSDSSKTVTVPGTRDNNQLFAQLFEIGVDSTFDVNRKRDCWVLQDGIQVFEGTLRLRKIARNDWNTVSYDTMMFGRLADLFSELKNDDGLELKLGDLDLSEWVHFRTRESVLGSWVGDVTRDGAPYLSYAVGPTYSVTETNFAPGGRTVLLLGATHSLALSDVVRFEMDFPGSTTVAFDRSNGHHTVTGVDEYFAPSVTVNVPFSSGATNTGVLSRYVSRGEGYVYPTVNVGKNSLSDAAWAPDDFRPGVYLKTYVDAIFDRLGFTYESTFFESDYFCRQVWWGPQWASGFQGATAFNISSASVPGNLFLNLLQPEVTVDAAASWAGQTGSTYGTFSYQNTGATDSVRKLYFTGTLAVNAPLFYVDLAILRVYRSMDSTGATDAGWAGGTGAPVGSYLGSPPTVPPDYTIAWNSPGGFVAPHGTLSGSVYSFTVSTPYLALRPGEQVRWVLEVFSDDADPGPTPAFDFVTFQCSVTDNSLQHTEPSTTCRDFLVFLINAFNLYVEPDRRNERNIVIEPFDAYYGQGTPLDWTDRVDVSQQVDIEPVSPEMARTFLWAHQDDSDFHNKGYKEAFRETYGQQEVDRDNDFSNARQETRVPVVAATPLVDTRGGLSLVLPTVVKDASWAPMDSFKPRVLYFTGLRYSPIGFGVGTTGTTASPVPYGTTAPFGNTCYGYGGHLDNPQDATLDVDFGLLRKYYYGDGGAFYVAQDGLYNRFYRRWLDELTDTETRRVTFSMKLRPTDLGSLSFRRIYQVKGTNLRLQKIEDYNPLTGEPCRVEFLTVRQSPAYGAGATALGVGVNPTQGTGTVPSIPGDSGVGGNTVPIGTQVGSVEVLGTGNVVSVTADAVQLVGYDNRIEAGSTVLVIGTRNTVKS